MIFAQLFLVERGRVLGDLGFRELALVLAVLLSVLAFQHLLSVRVEVELGDLAVRGVNADVDEDTVHLLSLCTLDVNDKLLAVHLGDLAFYLSLELSTDNGNFVVLADRDGSHLL